METTELARTFVILRKLGKRKQNHANSQLGHKSIESGLAPKGKSSGEQQEEDEVQAVEEEDYDLDDDEAAGR